MQQVVPAVTVTSPVYRFAMKWDESDPMHQALADAAQSKKAMEFRFNDETFRAVVSVEHSERFSVLTLMCEKHEQ